MAVGYNFFGKTIDL